MDEPLHWDMINVFYRIFLAVFLVLLNGFFVAAEFAIVRARFTRIANIDTRNGKMAKKIVNNLDTYLSATQLGITLASLGLGWVGQNTVELLLKEFFASIGFSSSWLLNSLSLSSGFLIVTFFHIVVGEMAPKSLAIDKAEDTMLFVARPLHAFYRLVKPFIYILNNSANFFLRFVLRVELTDPKKQAHTEEEIRMLLAQSHKSGVIDQAELTLFDNIFEFTDRIAREVMVPRVNMICLFAEKDFSDNFAVIKNSRHTRFPLCGSDKDDIKGIIHIRDVYEFISEEGGNPVLTKLARPSVVVPETMELKDILRNLQKKRVEMAIVVDEFGGTAGLVTTEDIIEEIFGEIQDEFDDEKPLFQTVGDATSIASRLLIEEVNDYFKINIQDTDNDTIGGWLFSQLEKVPCKGDDIKFASLIFEVEEVDKLKIKRIIVKSDLENKPEDISDSD